MAVLETLISARIADNMTNTRFEAPAEVMGLGFANILSGFLGGMPCTGVLIRTAVNVTTGATDKMSQFINAIFVAIVVILLLPQFSYIPMPVIASILITSACRLIPKKFIAQTFAADKVECGLLFVTWATCVFVDGAVGLVVGSFMALMRHAVQTDRPLIVAKTTETKFGNTLAHISLAGSLTFINSLRFEDEVNEVITKKNPAFVLLKLDRLETLDFDALASLKILVMGAEKQNVAKMVICDQWRGDDSKVKAAALLKNKWYLDNVDYIFFDDEN